MRLKKLKLAGFKSFVDPTSVPLPSNLIAVVGPNGCGKSNIIDAVRWVMGESSAKNLRGESMVDVIFNGSSARKPVSQAFVELLFDNSDGSLGGEYAQYSEISIKRQVGRDGSSNYYLNNTRCRRKDITDVFLGTGLGARSYSIIEQGTISRLIEAKPEELRIFLEEAAGISKYKERRRETENRIRNTRENLTRLQDIRDELEKQLERLNRQAKAAERYKELRTEQHLIKAQLSALRWQTLNHKIEEHNQIIKEQELQLEALITEQRSFDNIIEQQRDKHHELNDDYNDKQSRYYRIGADMARLEEAIQHQRQRRQQLQQDLQQVQADRQALQQQYDDDNAAIANVEKEIQQLAPAELEAMEKLEASQQSLTRIESERAEWQQQWDEFNQQAAESSKTAHVEQTRIQHLEQTLQAAEQQITKLTAEIQLQNPDALQAELDEINDIQQQINQQIAAEKEKLEHLQTLISQGREQVRQFNQQLDEQRNKLQSMRGRYASLEALQQAALGQNDNVMIEWLKQQQLSNAKRLAQQLKVENGWETAVETVLGAYLQAVCVADVENIADLTANIPNGEIIFVDQRAHASENSSGEQHLARHVQSDYPLLKQLLAGIHCAADCHEAKNVLAKLASHESVITRDGIWLGHGWLRIAKEHDQTAGVLAREQQLAALTNDIAAAVLRLEELEQQTEDARQQLIDSEQARDQQQQVLVELNHQQADSNAKIRVKQNQLQQMRDREKHIQQEIQGQQQKSEQAEQTLKDARHAWQQAMSQMDENADSKNRLSENREHISQALEQARLQARQDRELAHELQIRLQSNKTQLTSAKQNIERMVNELERMTARHDGLVTAMEKADNPEHDLEAQLKDQLSQHLAAENALKQARSLVEQCEHSLRDAEESRQQADQAARVVESRLGQLRVDSQEVRVRAATIEESINETEYKLEQLIAEMPELASENAWDEQLEAVTARIQRLGAINLAAIDEYKTESERKEYLDKQSEDLTSALTTLENAIRKIDKETRQRFKDTYDQVNNSFKNLFPRLFGGGQAYLELTGEDLLDTGVTVMARPPGKRNSSIHLLSGGEKAMTAVALVFAIFQLNPSPFCMLDEVDAPLDDANVGRFCNLVKEMSETVQFIFITHNKVTMELADHLSGVTMKEPGVSRLVSVDVDQAVSLAEA